MDFYTLGGVELPAPVELNIEGPGMLNQLSFRLGGGNWFLGARQMYRNTTTELASRGEAGLLPPPGTLPPLDNFIDTHLNASQAISGLGVLAEYDSRNNPFNPEQGYYYSAQFMLFDNAIGSDFDYSQSTLSGLNYWTFEEKYVLGWRLEYDGVSADDDTRLPAYVPPTIRMRGIPAGRYQGNHVALTEVQFDWKMTFRWKFSVFAGGGRVAQHFSDLGDADTEFSKGVGFRYLVARRYGFAMGIDIARGPEESAFYIQAGSTW
jgi:outer membrane translocation and assembly module TamA